MKAVIMAGGNATRLHPLTLATNKHLLPIYDKPVIYYGLQTIVDAGIDRIMIITSPQYVEDFVKLLGSGQQFTSQKTGSQIQIVYGIQNSASGIAYGLHIASDYIGTDSCLLYLGDNIIEDSLAEDVKSFTTGAKVFLKEVADPERFGVATVDQNGQVTEIIEKPKEPKSNWAVVGTYLYDNTVFAKLKDLKLSARGELEITDLNNLYVQEGNLAGVTLKKPWFDIGTFDSLVEASVYMKQKHHDNK
ncbi:MAG: sugar phosphate nucleotidyltransferase [bacterium]|nr:sugar phosphate nucleotidyltransferase [bacterium]